MSGTSLKLVILSMIVAALIVLLSWQTFLNQVNGLGYDFTLRIAGGFKLTSGVVIVAIDEASLDRHGAWPWPRFLQAQLVRGVAADAPSAVGIDMLMHDVTTPEADQAMADAIRQTPNVVLAGIEYCIIVSDPAGQVVYQNTAARRLAAFSEEPPPLWQYLSALLDGRRLMEDFARMISSEEPTHVDAVPSSQ